MDGKTDERSKLLLERLKMLEAENSSLVLENEQQRQQYEKCLDEIANQVVQALLAQKVRGAPRVIITYRKVRGNRKYCLNPRSFH